MEGLSVVGGRLMEFYVGGKKLHSFWEPGESSPYLARHLIEPVRATMGFWGHSGIPVILAAECCGLLPGEFIALNRMLFQSDVSAVRFCRQFGLPASASVELKRPLRCRTCGSSLISLPCIMCWNGPDDDPHV